MRISDWSADVCSSDLPNDPTVVELTQNPGLSLSKRATGEGPYAVGQYINYEFIVTNTGNVTLTDVVVTDGNATIVSGSPVASLPPSQTATVIARHQVTQSDIDAGVVVNQATVKIGRASCRERVCRDV